MATTELEKTLSRMKVTIKAKELPGTPARGFSPSVRTWRTTLVREIKGEEKPLKLTLTILSPVEPTLSTVVECLTKDIEAGELTLWDFAQEFNKGKTDEATENMYATARRTASRAQRFFGDSRIIRNILGLPKAA